MAGETTKFFADAIFSGLNEGLRGRRALKEEQRLQALKLQEEERLRNAALRDLQDRQALQDQRFKEVLLPRELEKEERLRNAALRDLQDRQALQDQRFKEVLLPRELEKEKRQQNAIHNQYKFKFDLQNQGGTPLGSSALRSGGSSKALLTDDSGGLDWPAKERLYKEIDRLRKELDLATYDTDDLGRKTKKETINSTLVAALERQIEELVTKAYGFNSTPEVQRDKEDFINEVTKTASNPTAAPAPTYPTASPAISPTNPALIPQTLPQGEEMATTIYEDVATVLDVVTEDLTKGANEFKAVVDYMNKPTSKNELKAMNLLEKLVYKTTGRKVSTDKIRKYFKDALERRFGKNPLDASHKNELIPSPLSEFLPRGKPVLLNTSTNNAFIDTIHNPRRR